MFKELAERWRSNYNATTPSQQLGLIEWSAIYAFASWLDIHAAEQSVHPTLLESAKCECAGKYYHADCKLVYRSPQSG